GVWGGKRTLPAVLLVGVQEDPAALGDAMHPHCEAVGLLEDRLEAAIALHARNLHTVLRAVRETLLGSRELSEICGRKPERAEEVARPHERESSPAPLRSPAWRPM